MSLDNDQMMRFEALDQKLQNDGLSDEEMSEYESLDSLASAPDASVPEMAPGVETLTPAQSAPALRMMPLREEPDPAMANLIASLKAAAQGSLQGQTYGFSDELMGLTTFPERLRTSIEAPLRGRDADEMLYESSGVIPNSDKSPYVQVRNQYRKENELAREEHPIAFGVGELTGSLLAPGPRFKGPTGAAALAPGTGSVARGLKTGLVVGAGAGAGMAGTSQSGDPFELSELGETAAHTALGAGLGGLTGAGMGKFGEWLSQKLGPRLASKAAGVTQERLEKSFPEMMNQVPADYPDLLTEQIGRTLLGEKIVRPFQGRAKIANNALNASLDVGAERAFQDFEAGQANQVANEIVDKQLMLARNLGNKSKAEIAQMAGIPSGNDTKNVVAQKARDFVNSQFEAQRKLADDLQLKASATAKDEKFYKSLQDMATQAARKDANNAGFGIKSGGGLLGGAVSAAPYYLSKLAEGGGGMESALMGMGKNALFGAAGGAVLAGGQKLAQSPAMQSTAAVGSAKLGDLIRRASQNASPYIAEQTLGLRSADWVNTQNGPTQPVLEEEDQRAVQGFKDGGI